MSTLFFSSSPQLRKDVAVLFEKYKNEIPRDALMMLSPPGGERKYYVYEWFTKDAGKVFYVGKGTGSRYRHILTDMNRPRGQEYLELQEQFGIDFRFLATDLTSREAEIYEICIMHERTDAGEVLLQSAHNPGATRYWEQVARMKDACAKRTFVPEIVVSDYRKRYFNVKAPSYDPPDLSVSAVTLLASVDKSAPGTASEINQLREQLLKSGRKVFATVAKKTQAVIEFDNMNYDDYIRYKEAGLLVFHAFDVQKALGGDDF